MNDELLAKNFNHLIVVLVALNLASLIWIAGCWTSRPASYGLLLQECNQKATTCEESIKCENDVRAKFNRPLRDADAGCE